MGYVFREACMHPLLSVHCIVSTSMYCIRYLCRIVKIHISEKLLLIYHFNKCWYLKCLNLLHETNTSIPYCLNNLTNASIPYCLNTLQMPHYLTVWIPYKWFNTLLSQYLTASITYCLRILLPQYPTVSKPHKYLNTLLTQ